MYTAMIVEDEVHILKHLNKMLSAMDAFIVKGAFSTPEEAYTAFPDILPDVVFLDIEMPRMNGIELASRLLAQKSDLKIIFTTAYGNYALDAFEVEAIDYLMKPIMPDRLKRVLERLDKITGVQKAKASLLKENNDFPVRCFGCFDARDQQQQLIKWSTKKAEELFAYFLVNQGKHISKWELLEAFWGDVEEERGAHNLYNTIYRIKQVLKTLPFSPQIQKINEGYVLEAQENLSDLGQLLKLMKQNRDQAYFSMEAAKTLFFSYATPLFGNKDYFWSLSLQKHVAKEYGRLCSKL
ncbi:MAG: response regulator receiver and domain protein, partial [Herbinix sp.]|nr:response regulator receiver and domain protein [Herbinix sp.]